MKLIGTCSKHKNGNYRVEYFKVDRDSDIGFVEVGCYLDCSLYSSYGACLRALNGIWNRKVLGLELDGLNLTIEIPDGIFNYHQKEFGYCTFCCRFELNGIGRKLDELVYEVLESFIIEMIEDSKCIIIDK